MMLHVVGHVPYRVLSSGILIVEPHLGLLHARAMLVDAAEIYFCNSGAGGSSSYRLNTGECGVSVAVLSESLGRETLLWVAQAVRDRWPQSLTLLLRTSLEPLDEALFDAAIDCHSRPEELLAALATLASRIGRGKLAQVQSGHRVPLVFASAVDWGGKTERTSEQL